MSRAFNNNINIDMKPRDYVSQRLESFLSLSDLETGQSYNDPNEPLDIGSRSYRGEDREQQIIQQIISFFRNAEEEGFDIKELMKKIHQELNDSEEDNE